ncbi:MAG: methyltransferase domain-containing protein [Alphaproteobacteria bacterium]|nr:methyltransferase domain-containing protein [Alphaproteobacteria bacterium]
MSDTIPHIFDERLRRLRRARAAAGFSGYSFLAEAAAGELSDRIEGLKREFACAAFSGARVPQAVRIERVFHGDAAASFAGPQGVVFEEGLLPFAPRALDLYASVLTLHAVNDLPGALLQIRRALKPGGVFMAAMLGGETLKELRESLAIAEIEIEGGLSPRVAPFADVRDCGGLLQRAGLEEPVADSDTITVAYEHPLKLFQDLRGMAETNVLVERRKSFLKRAVLARACEVYFDKFRRADGRVPATFQILYMTGRVSR